MAGTDLAILGGPPLNPNPIPTYNTIGTEEKEAVMRVLDSGELSGFVASPGERFWGGNEVRGLEADFREHFGVKHAIAVNSATSALHCATMAMGLGPGDEVIVSPYTMSASATAILMTGAVPVFADIEDRTFGLDPQSVEAAVTCRTRGIMAVNLFGHGARLDELRAIADRRELFLIEDNAQAPDARYRGRKTGTIGACGIFSFNRHKTMQCGEGGVLITDDEQIALKAALFRNHGEVVVEAMGIEDIVNAFGVNYRMTEMEAAVARVQLRKLPALNAYRATIADRLTSGFRTVEAVSPPITEAACTHVYYFYVMKFHEEASGISRDLFCRAVTAEGFPLRAGYVKPLYLEPMYQRRLALGRDGFPFTANRQNTLPSYQPGLCPVTERLQDQDLMLTHLLYEPLTVTDADRLVAACEKVVTNRDALLSAFRQPHVASAS